MSFRVFLSIAVAVLAFLFAARELNYENSGADIELEEDFLVDPNSPCEHPIKNTNSLWKFLKDCLEYSEESMGCAAKYLEVGEADPFIIGLECTPNLPEVAKEILREVAATMYARSEIASNCVPAINDDCNHDYLKLGQKHKELMESYMELRTTFRGEAKIADDKFGLLILRVASNFGHGH